MVKYDEVDSVCGKLVKKLSKNWRIVRESKSFKGLKNLQKPSIQRNVYQNNNSSSIRYDKLKLPLELWQFFKLFWLSSGAFSISHLEQLLLKQS